jgi:hypothetical protein
VIIGAIDDWTTAFVRRGYRYQLLNPRYAFGRAQDMAYSQALLKVGFIKGSGRPQSTPAEKSSKDVQYMTDGLRVVLVFGDRPASLEGIDFFSWERVDDYR